MRKTLLVCSDPCRAVEECLAAASCRITKAKNGTGAVSCARRESFSLAVVVSTGNEMDLTETVLNLRDITRTMEILVVVDCVKEDKEPVRTAAQTLPNTAIVSLDDLRKCLQRDRIKIFGGSPASTRNRVK